MGTLLLSFLVLFSTGAFSQSTLCLGAEDFHIVVLGSSTAAGAGPSTSDSAWVNRYRAYVQSINPNNQVTNLAVGGYNTYRIMPTGHIPPISGRPSPDTSKNITKALSLAPDAIIVNMPSNDAASGFTAAEQVYNFDSIWNMSWAAGVPIWIATVQPRNFGASAIAIQLEARDSIFSRYGLFAIDFWNGFADTNHWILPQYNSGDGVHQNDAGHRKMLERVQGENILAYLFQGDSIIDYITKVELDTGFSICGDSNTQVHVTITNLGIDDSSAGFSLFMESRNLNTLAGQMQIVAIDPPFVTCESRTFSFYVNTLGGDEFSFKSYLPQISNQNLLNDTSEITFQFLGFPSVSPLNDSICLGDTATLAAIIESGDTSFWYPSFLGDTIIGSGPSISHLGAYAFVQSVRGDLVERNSIATTENNGIDWNGAMFDVTAKEDLTIDNFDLMIANTGSQSVEIYYKMGSHIGAETNAAAWTFLDSVTVNVVSNTELTHIPIGGIPIPKDSTIGLYMQMQNPSSRVRYLWLSNPITRSNNEIEIFTGSGADHNFGGNYYPRDLNCRVYYHFGFKPEGDCASPRTLVEAIQSFKPAAGFSFQPNGTQVLFSNLSLGADSFYWDFGNGATSNLLNPFYDYGQDGTFTIQLIAKNECGADTATQDVTVMAVGVDELITQLHIWPNPASSILHIEIDQPGVVAQIYTNMGSLVLRSELSDKVHEIDVSTLPVGIYQLELLQDGQRIAQRKFHVTR